MCKKYSDRKNDQMMIKSMDHLSIDLKFSDYKFNCLL